MKLKLLAGLLCAACVLPTMAQEKKSAVSFFGNYNKPSNGDGMGNVFASYGYLVTSQLELGLFVTESFSSGTTTTGVGGNAQYYFGNVGKVGSYLPYLKGDVLSMSGGPASYTQYCAFAGIGYAMTETTEAFAEVGATNADISGNSQSGSQVNLGIKFRF